MSGPKTNGGMVWSNPITAILKADPVSSYTNHSRATLFMLSPIWETTWPENSRPKFLVLSNSHPDPARPSGQFTFSLQYYSNSRLETSTLALNHIRLPDGGTLRASSPILNPCHRAR